MEQFIDIALTPQDARKIGINTDELKYIYPVSTANGETLAAKIHINEIKIGTIDVHDIDGTVSKNGLLDTSLLGMSFLSQLKKYETKGNILTLTD